MLMSFINSELHSVSSFNSRTCNPGGVSLWAHIHIFRGRAGRTADHDESPCEHDHLRLDIILQPSPAIARDFKNSSFLNRVLKTDQNRYGIDWVFSRFVGCGTISADGHLITSLTGLTHGQVISLN